jgi:hypothetical protein
MTIYEEISITDGDVAHCYDGDRRK